MPYLVECSVVQILGGNGCCIDHSKARVSGHDQRSDLERQIERLEKWARTERPGREMLVLSDIGSGLNAARKRLQQLLKLVCEDRVAEVAITSGDRLTRFGQEYLQTLSRVLAWHTLFSSLRKKKRLSRN